jgi:hypothetical protein
VVDALQVLPHVGALGWNVGAGVGIEVAGDGDIGGRAAVRQVEGVPQQEGVVGLPAQVLPHQQGVGRLAQMVDPGPHVPLQMLILVGDDAADARQLAAERLTPLPYRCQAQVGHDPVVGLDQGLDADVVLVAVGVAPDVAQHRESVAGPLPFVGLLVDQPHQAGLLGPLEAPGQGGGQFGDALGGVGGGRRDQGLVALFGQTQGDGAVDRAGAALAAIAVQGAQGGAGVGLQVVAGFVDLGLALGLVVAVVALGPLVADGVALDGAAQDGQGPHPQRVGLAVAAPQAHVAQGLALAGDDLGVHRLVVGLGAAD